MSTHNQQIKPAEFKPGDGALSGSQPSVPDSDSHAASRWVLPLLLALVVMMAFVVFWLPGRVKQPPVPVLTTSEVDRSTPAATRGQTTGRESSPWSDAQMAKERKQAQDILHELLEVQFKLEELGVKQWVAEAFGKARETAAAGDVEYREGHFAEASVSYQQGLEELQVLLDMAPQVLEESLSDARQAIDAGRAENANTALLIAAAIAPTSPELRDLRQRVAVLEELSSMLMQAEEAENIGDLARAESILTQAVALDKQSFKARSELKRVARAYTQQRFNDAMSRGYTALDQGQFERASTGFKRAAQLVAGSAVAASALEDVAVAETAYRLSELQINGQAFEAAEQWVAAVTAFEQALQIDDSLLFAQDGLKRSRVRARLDQQFHSAIDQPERLSDTGVADAAARLLRQAATISPRGPILQRQLQQLEEILEKANTPLPVILRSDMETEVTLRKVARLGRFQQRELSLRPGTYVAVGTRDGYRDVRLTFSINHGSETPTVVIACTEQI